MLEQFRHQEDFSDIDFSFVYELDEDTLNFFFDVTDLAIEAMEESIESDPNYVPGVSDEKNLQIQNYFRKLLELYTDYELYEECESIITILDTFENYLKNKQEKVANVN